MRALLLGAVLAAGCYQSIETTSYESCVDGMCTCEQSSRSCCDPNVCGYENEDACNRVCEPGLPLQGIRDFDIDEDHWCYIEASGALQCEEIIVLKLQAMAPEGTFRAVSVDSPYACAVSDAGALVCWDLETGGFQEFGSDFVDVQATSIFNVNGSSNSACGLHSDGTIECFGPSACDGSGPPAGTFRAFADGGAFCALDMEGQLACWGCGENYAPPPGPWAQVTWGFDFCGLRLDGSLDCDRAGEPAPEGVFLAAKPFCGIQENGWLTCWNEEPEPLPIGAFVGLDANRDGGCGLRATGELACWGELLE